MHGLRRLNLASISLAPHTMPWPYRLVSLLHLMIMGARSQHCPHILLPCLWSGLFVVFLLAHFVLRCVVVEVHEAGEDILVWTTDSTLY